MVGLRGVSADAGLANLNFEHAEVSKLYVFALRERFRKNVERALDDVFYIVLENVAAAAFLFVLINSLHNFSFSKILHGLIYFIVVK